MASKLISELTRIRALEMDQGYIAAHPHYLAILDGLNLSPDQRIAGARFLAGCHHFELAVTLANAAVPPSETDPALQFMLGHIHLLCEQPGQAIKKFAPLLGRNFPQAPLLTELGTCHLAQGEVSRAKQCFGDAIKADPGYIPAWLELAQIANFDKDLEFSSQILELYASKPKLPFDWAARLTHAIGLVHMAHQEHEKAFTAFCKVGADLPKDQGFGEAQAIQLHEQALTFAPSENKHVATNAAPESPQRIFIIGMPRSGTTLIEQILLSGGNGYSCAETPALTETVSCFMANLPKRAQAAAENYLARTESQNIDSQNAAFCIDKTPTNYLHAGFIKQILPDAKIIHCQRDPIAVCWSAFTTWFRTPTRWANDLEQIGRFYSRYWQTMRHFEDVMGDQIIDLEYEAVIEHPNLTLKNLFKECNLPWQDTSLDFYKKKQIVATPSMAQVRRPIYDSSLKKYHPFLPYLEPLIAELEKAGIPIQD